MNPGAQVLLLPARTPDIHGRTVYYLFSVRQVAEVLLNTMIQRVPFAPPYVQGVAGWCERVLPVLCLERCLGSELLADRMPPRDVVVRSVVLDEGGQPEEHYAICRVGAAIRHVELPLDCEPGTVPEGVTDASCLTAVYDMQASILMVVNLEKIINAYPPKPKPPSQEAAKGSGLFARPSLLWRMGQAETCDALVRG
jgi:chemotaxis signal transduction protein